MSKTRASVIAALAVLAFGFGSTPAFAGEVTGNGKVLPVNANSDCAYSGLEDDPLDPGVTQNWGQIPKADRDFLASIGVSPSVLCNGHLYPLK
jgi:hypothetical protein